MHKPMTLPFHENRDRFYGTERQGLPHSAGGSVVVRGAPAGFAGWLRRRTLTQYPGLVFSLLDGLRAGRSCAGTRSPCSFQGIGAARGTTRPLGRHAGDWLCRHLRDVADMAVLKGSYE